jgi:glycosyltransferase involved in cell wall biosynthesis
MGVLKQLVKKNQGLLVNEQKVGEVAKAMLILMKNKKLREKMGKNAREDVVKHYTWDFMNRKILEELTRRL